MKKNIIKATIIVLSLVISAALISGSYVYHSNKENNEMQIAKQESIAEYGVIAEIYYDTFKEPTDEENVQNILEYNGFDLNDEYPESSYKIYVKDKYIDEKKFRLSVSLKYPNHIGAETAVTYSISYKADATNKIDISKVFNAHECNIKLTITEGEEGHNTGIDLLTGEFLGDSYDGNDEKKMYNKYLAGDYDAQITEMETIMEEELQPLPEDYVASSTNK